MARNKNKKTTFISSKSVVSDDFMNSIYGGLKGTEEESLYGTTDPLVGGHVHDGISADGHAQKIDLSKHVTGQLPVSMLSGSIGKPSDPVRSIQFNSADSFGGSPAFSYYSSTDSVQLSKDYKFYYGSVDSTTSFYIQNTVNNTTSFMRFVSNSTTDIDFSFGSSKDDTDLVYSYVKGSGTSYDAHLFSEVNSSQLGYTDANNFNIWKNISLKTITLWENTATSFLTSKYFHIRTPNQQESMTLDLPKYQANTTDLVLKVSSISSGGIFAELTWDTFHSPGTPVNGFQFNSADTFGGAETFYFEPSTRDVVFAKDHKWWFGSTDSSNSFWLEHEIDGTLPKLEFYASNNAQSEFLFTNGATGTADIIVRLQNTDAYLYPEVDGNAYLGRAIMGTTYKWRELYIDNVSLFHSSDNRDITLNAEAVEESYSLQFPKYRPTTVDMFMKVVNYGASVELTWDNNINAQQINGSVMQAQSLMAMSLNVNNNYTFPTVDGSANYILRTDGAGNVSWSDDEGIFNVIEDTAPELGGQLVTGANKISFASGNNTSELSFQYTLNSEPNHTYISTVKSFNIFLDKNGGDDGQAVRVYNNINPTSGSPNDTNYIWKLHENGTMYMKNNIVIQSTDNIEIGTETITETKIGQWNTAYSWGDHSVQGYLTTDSTISAGQGLIKTGNTIDVSGTVNSININTADIGSLSVNGNYTLPAVDGSANYILKTDGSGNVSWTVDSGTSGLENIVEDTTPQLGGDLDAQNNHISSVNNLKFYNSGPIIRSTNFNRSLYINPAITSNPSNSVRIGKIGSTSDSWDNGHAANISKLESDTGSKFLLASNAFANTSVIQINDNLDTTDSQSNLREGIELRAWETTGGIASVAIKSLSLNSSNGQPQLKSPELRFYNAGDKYVYLKAPGTSDLPASIGYVLPGQDGSAGHVLRTDGSSNLSWVAQSETIINAGQGLSKTGNTIDVSGTVNSININTADIGSLSVNGNYTLPVVDGSANYILKTNGSGVVVWTVDREAQHWQTNSTGDIYYASGNMGVGISNPDVRLHMSGDGPYTSQIRLDQYSGTHPTTGVDGPDMAFYSARGSEASPQVRNAGDYVGAFNMRYYNGSSYSAAGFFGWQVGDTPSNGSSWFNIKTNVDGNNRIRIKVEKSGAITFGNSADGTEMKFPLVDGTAGYVLATDGSGQLLWTEAETFSGGNNINVTGSGTVETQNDILINTLDSTFAEINELSIGGNYTFPTVDGSPDYILKTNGSGVVTWTVDGGSGISNIVEDTTPELGGQLITGSNKISFGSGNATSEIDLKYDASTSHVAIASIRSIDLFLDSNGDSNDTENLRVFNNLEPTSSKSAVPATNTDANAIWRLHESGDMYLTGDIKTLSGGDLNLNPNGTGVAVFYGNSDRGSGQFKLNCENNSHGITIKGPPHSAAANYTLTLPNDDGNSGQVLQTDGGGVLSWVNQTSGGLNNLVEDTTPQLGGDLSLNSNDITGTGNVNITGDIAGNNIRANNTLRLLEGVEERTQEITNATGTVTHDCSGGHIFFHSSISGNFTVDLINLSLATGYSTAVTLMLQQGGTGRDIVGLQIGGVGQTIIWQGGSGPTAGTNNVDVVTFSIYRRVSSYVVLGQLMDFG